MFKKRFAALAAFFIFLSAWNAGCETPTDPVQEQTIAAEETEKPAYKISYKFNEGTEVYYRLNFNRTDEFVLSGRKTETENKIILHISQLFGGADAESNGTLKMFYLQGWQNNRKIFQNGKTVDMKISPEGEILETRGLQEVAAEFLTVLQRSLADYIPGFDRLPLRIDLTKIPSNTFNTLWQSFILPLPDKPVAAGDTWKKQDRQIGTILYKLEKIENNRAYIKISADDNEIELEGNAVFDMDGGFIISQQTQMATGETGKILERLAKRIDAPSLQNNQLNLPEKTRIDIHLMLLEE